MRKNYNSTPEDIKFILKIIAKYKEIFIKRILGFPSPLVMLSLSKICISDFMSVVFLPSTLMDRSSHQRCSTKIGVLRNFAKFAGKHLCQSHFFNKVAGLQLY